MNYKAAIGGSARAVATKRRIDRARCGQMSRRGQATLWLILTAPALLALLVMVTDIGNLWLARVQLESALEAAALAGAKTWGDSDSTDSAAARDAARTAAIAFAGANTAGGNSVTLLSAEVILGSYDSDSMFDEMATNVPADQRACQVAKEIAVGSLWTGFAGPFSVRATVTAKYSPGGGAALVRVAP